MRNVAFRLVDIAACPHCAGTLQVIARFGESALVYTSDDNENKRSVFTTMLETPSRGVQYGLAAICCYVVFLPLRNFPDVATFVLVALGLLALLSSTPLRPRLQRSDFIVLSLVVGAALISTLHSADPGRGVRYLAYLGVNLFLLVLAAGMVSRASARVIAGCLALVGVLHLSALLLVHFLAAPQMPDALIDRLHAATLIVPNDALLLGLCLPAVAMLAPLGDGARMSGRVWIALSVYLALSAYVSYLLLSKLTLLSVFAASLAVAAIWTAFRHPVAALKYRWAMVFGLALSLLVVSAAAWYFGNQSTTRMSLWLSAASHHETTREILFGAGPNSFLYNPQEADSQFDKGDLVVPWVHNAYLEAYYDQGLAGLGGLLALSVLPILRAIRIDDPAVRTLLLASMIVFCLAAWFEVTLTRRFYFAYLAIMYGLASAQHRGR